MKKQKNGVALAPQNLCGKLKNKRLPHHRVSLQPPAKISHNPLVVKRQGLRQIMQRKKTRFLSPLGRRGDERAA